jgi:hypothetical protein
MLNNAITIRPAETEDIKDIWDLLHASSKTWSPEHITSQLDKLTVLVKENKILGVLYGIISPGKNTEIIWVAIHPMYPEKKLREVMIQGITITQYQTVKVKAQLKKIYPDSFVNHYF